MSEYIYFNSRDEFLRIETSHIAYCIAEGNYTRIVLTNGYEGLVCMNLGKMATTISQCLHDKANSFARVGKCHIVNLNYILSINTLKQTLELSDQKTFLFSLNISKDALKKLKDLIILAKQRKK